MPVPRNLPDQIADLYHRIAEMERRQANSKRTGTVEETDYEKGMYRVRLKDEGSNGKPYLSPWIPLKEIAMGDIKAHFPLSKGEQVTVVSESGDLTDAEIGGSIPSKNNKRPHNKGGEGVLTVGDTRIAFTGSEVRITSPKIVLAGDVYLGGESGAKLIHRKGDADTAGDLAVGSASKVYAI